MNVYNHAFTFPRQAMIRENNNRWVSIKLNVFPYNITHNRTYTCILGSQSSYWIALGMLVCFVNSTTLHEPSCLRLTTDLPLVFWPTTHKRIASNSSDTICRHTNIQQINQAPNIGNYKSYILPQPTRPLTTHCSATN